MNPYLTINSEIEQAAFAMPVERWFTVAQLHSDKVHDSRCYLYLVDMHLKQYKRSDGAALIQNDQWYFCWHKAAVS